MTTTYIVLTLLAVWRVSRLLAIDFITEPYRRWMEARHPKLGYLAECPWCTSIWVAPVVVVPPVIWPDNRAVFAAIVCLAASGVAGFLATIEDRLDR